tara:strand:- start:433 stop:639 length:207 start_codon:yes stop_codon:yes gene_type:complete
MTKYILTTAGIALVAAYLAGVAVARYTQEIVMGDAVPDNYMCIKDSSPDAYLCYPEYDVPWYHTDPRK